MEPEFKYYILDEKGYPEEVDALAWARWQKLNHDRYHHNTLILNARVSTVFMGIAPAEDGNPRLFETLCFTNDNPSDGPYRTFTYHGALNLHNRLVNELRLTYGRTDFFSLLIDSLRTLLYSKNS